MPSPHRPEPDDGVDISVQLRHVCLEYPYKNLQAATNNFDSSRQLGEGSAGTVFKAEMQDGSYAAVKVIDLATLGDNALVAGFEEEVMILSKFRHPNVVVLMGWARHKARRFLIYEFLAGGDVFGRLQKCKDGRHPFLWYERLSVCRDAAMGLAHLHNATPHAFHRDVKSSNILLGPSGAKIADFGLSVVGKTRTQSAYDCEFPSGTPGYTCPLYVQSGKMTEGSEVFSFGMVLLEVLLNMMPAGMVGEHISYPIQECIAPAVPGALERAVSSADTAAGWPPPVAREVAALGLACIDPDEARRPSFNDVCKLLRFLQEQFPPTCVMAPMQGLPPPGPPGPPLQTGVLNLNVSPFGLAPPQGSLGPALIQQMPLVGGPQAPQPGGMPLGTVPPGMLLQQGAVRPGFNTSGVYPCALQAPPKLIPAVPQQVCIAQPGPIPVPVVPVVQGPLLGGGIGRPIAPPPQGNQVPVEVTLAPPNAVPVEVALEVAHVHGAALASMRPEFRMLPLLPAIDPDGRRMAVLGRQHQPQWFESVLLDQNDLSCISREAFALAWGGSDPSQAALSLRVLGSNIILVDESVAQKDKLIPLQPGSLITFAFQASGSNLNLCVILAFRVHCAPQLAAPLGGLQQPVGLPQAGAGPAGAIATGRPSLGHALGPGANFAPQLPQPPAPAESQDGTWDLECIYATGLGPEAFWALPAPARTLSLALGGGAAPRIFGRAHQPDMFEALLSHEMALLGCISRNHVQIEEVARSDGNVSGVVSIGTLPSDESPAIRVTNLSQNVIVASRVNLQPLVKPLFLNDTAELHDGDTLSFATEQHPACPLGDEASGKSPRGRTSSAAQAAVAAAAVMAKTRPLGESGDDTEAGVTVVPFLTFRVRAPPVPPPPSPFVMVSPPSLSIVDLDSPQAVADVLNETGAVAEEGSISATRASNPVPLATMPAGGGAGASERIAATSTAPAVSSPSKKGKASSTTKNGSCMSQ